MASSPVGGPTSARRASWLFAYDGLDRFRVAKRGTLAFGSQDPPTVAGPLIQQTWALDGQANWTGHDETTLRGFRDDRRESGVLVPKTHFKLRPNQRNEIDAVESWKWESMGYRAPRRNEMDFALSLAGAG